MRRGFVALIVVAGGIVPAAPALAALDHPARQSRLFTVQNAFGSCQLGGTTQAAPSPAGVGTVTTTGWTDCESLSVTPRTEFIRSDIVGTGATPASGPERAEKLCESAGWCSMLHSRRFLPPGDYRGVHRLSVDLTEGGTSNTYWLSYPSDCRLSGSDSGYLFCEFEQAVTYLPAALPVALP